MGNYEHRTMAASISLQGHWTNCENSVEQENTFTVCVCVCEGRRERANGKKREMVKWSFIIAKWLWTGCTRLLLVRNGLRSYTTCTYGWVYERESGGTNKVVLWICFHVRGVILQYVCGWPFSHNIHHWMQKKTITFIVHLLQISFISAAGAVISYYHTK